MYEPFTEERKLNGCKVLEYFTHGFNGCLYQGLAFEAINPYTPYLLMPLITIIEGHPPSERMPTVMKVLEDHCQ